MGARNLHRQASNTLDAVAIASSRHAERGGEMRLLLLCVLLLAGCDGTALNAGLNPNYRCVDGKLYQSVGGNAWISREIGCVEIDRSAK